MLCNWLRYTLGEQLHPPAPSMLPLGRRLTPSDRLHRRDGLIADPRP